MVDDIRRNRIRQRLGLDPSFAIIGDASGNYKDPNKPSYWRVRYDTGNGFSPAASVREPEFPLSPTIGLRVRIGWVDGERQIVGADNKALIASGYTPQSVIYKPTSAVGQSDIATLAVTQVLPTATKTVNVKSWATIIGGTLYTFPGSSIDLTSLIPSAGNMRNVVVFVKSDYTTLEAKGSTSRAMVDVPLDSADIQEALDARTAGSTPVWAIPLKDNQSSVTQDDINRGVDLRNFVNTSDVSLTNVPYLVAAPSTAASAGVAGQVAYDSSYFYVCVSANTWKRVVISTW